jgi:hypothetical protein
MTDNPFEWVKDLRRVVDDKLMADIVNDFRRGPAPPGGTTATVRVVGAGRVVDGSDVVAGGGTGWVDAPKVNDWTPPGLREMDRMMDAADLQDRLARVKELGEAEALKRAEAELKAAQLKKPKGGEK